MLKMKQFCLTDLVSVPDSVILKKSLIVHAIMRYHAICHFPSDAYHHQFIFTCILVHLFH